MKSIRHLITAAILVLVPVAGVLGHHNTQSEFGAFDSETVYVEGTISKVIWGNPHIAIQMVVTGGELEAGEKWRVASHPVAIQIAHGFAKEDFAEGDTIKLHAWKHVRGLPQLWPRAIQINDGPMQSNMRFTDMIDIAKGTFTAMNIVPADNLSGSPSARAGEAYVAKLREMGLLDADDNMIWPAP